MAYAALKWLGWRGGAAVAIALALALALWSRGSWKEEAGKWKKTAGVWHTAFDTQKSAYEAVQAAAKVKLEAQRKEQKNEYDAVAARADNANRKVAALVAASEQFARNNRVRRSQAGTAGGAAGGTAAAGQGDSAAGDSRSSDDAVVVPIDDFNLLVTNQGRLLKAHDWFKELEAKGLAEAAPAGGE